MKIKELVIASHNQGKIDEIAKMLSPYGVKVVSAEELNLPDVEETGTSFEENAILKAVTLSDISGLPCLADDSGLCVNALDGRPGVYTARYAEFDGKRDFKRAFNRLVGEINATKTNDWSAYFACVLALKIPNKECLIFEGRCEGNITKESSGDKGFGYDPIFIPKGHNKTFAWFEKEEKAKVSHRGIAFEKLIKEVFKTE